MEPRIKGAVSLVAGASLVAAALGCGTIFYPERRGQRGGRVDAGVAVLDGIGLLFFLIPGVIAFAVDFGDGAIYLPEGRGRADVRTIRFDPSGSEKATVERILRERTGYPVRLDGEDVRVEEVAKAELPARFTAAAR